MVVRFHFIHTHINIIYMYNIHASMALHPGLAGDQFIAVSNSFLGSLFVFVLFPSILRWEMLDWTCMTCILIQTFATLFFIPYIVFSPLLV